MINSIKTEPADKKDEIKFPLLMSSTKSGRVVYMTSEGEGYLLYSKDGDSIYESKCWDMGQFVQFSGSITLQNEDG